MSTPEDKKWNWGTWSYTHHQGGISRCRLMSYCCISHSNATSSLACGDVTETMEALLKPCDKTKGHLSSIFTIAAFLGQLIYIKSVQKNLCVNL